MYGSEPSWNDDAVTVALPATSPVKFDAGSRTGTMGLGYDEVDAVAATAVEEAASVDMALETTTGIDDNDRVTVATEAEEGRSTSDEEFGRAVADVELTRLDAEAAAKADEDAIGAELVLFADARAEEAGAEVTSPSVEVETAVEEVKIKEVLLERASAPVVKGSDAGRT